MKIDFKDINFIQPITEQVHIEPLKRKDKKSLLREINTNYSDLLPWCPWIESLKDMTSVSSFMDVYKHQLAFNSCFRLGIYYKSRLIGWVAAFDFDWERKTYYLGYWIATRFRLNGYVTYTAYFIQHLLLKLFDFNQLYILCDRNNFPSRTLAQKLGGQQNNLLSTKDFYCYQTRL